MTSDPPDTSAPLAKPLDRLALVEYVFGSPALQENGSLEWKVGYDLSSRPDAAKTAKQLIGFANREVSRAGRTYGGHAYLLLGVEPGQAPGVPTWDAADIQRWLERYVEPELRYQPHYVQLGKDSILVLDVDAPAAGDPIFAMQTSGGDASGTIREGTVFVRRSGISEPASAQEMRMLQDRLRAGTTEEPGLDFDLVANTDDLYAVAERLLDEEKRDEYLDECHRKLLGSLPSSRRDWSSILALSVSESRRPDDYAVEVQTFIDDCKARWWAFVADSLSRSEPSSFQLMIINDSDHGYTDVVVELSLPISRDEIHTSAEAAANYFDPPKEPVMWGERTILASIRDDLFPAISHVDLEAEPDGTLLVRFPPLTVRPRSKHRLEELIVVLPPKWEGQDLIGRWRATAAGVKGDLPGEVVMPVMGFDEHESPTSAHDDRS